MALSVVLLALTRPPEPHPLDVIEYGKRLVVSRIDSRLGSERYDAWLARTLGPEATINWDSDACGEGGKGYGAVPVCVTVDATLRPRGHVVISIRVGSSNGGIGGSPHIYSGMIEGLGPREDIDAGDLPLLASKVRAAQTLEAEWSRLPDVPPDEDGWIRQIQQTPAARLVARARGTSTFIDWITARAGPSAKLEWSVDGCRRRGHQGGARLDLKGDKDEWAYVAAAFEDPDVEVLTRVRVGTCRKGTWGRPIAARVRLRDKPPHYADTSEVSIDVLEAKLRAIRTRRSTQPLAKPQPLSK